MLIGDFPINTVCLLPLESTVYVVNSDEQSAHLGL